MFRHKIKMLFTTSIVVRVVILFNTSNRLFPSSDISQRGFSASSATYSSLIRNCNPRRGRGGHLPPPIGSSNRTALVDTRDSVEPEPRRDQHQRVRRAHQHAIPASSRDTHVFIMLRRIGNVSADGDDFVSSSISSDRRRMELWICLKLWYRCTLISTIGRYAWGVGA